MPFDAKVKGAAWAELHKDWVFANQEARKARLAVTGKYRDCALGNGTGPTLEELEECEQLEKKADEAKLREDAFIQNMFNEATGGG